ncbi:MAG: signal peptide peptidase SppA [Prevotellaceae bacterium]|nr:signal peptide peptidase SppA [Prevotellaceae bacterium]
MKQFLKFTLASILGLIVFTIVVALISAISVASIMTNEDLGESIKKNSILRINLSGVIEELKKEDPLSMFNDDDLNASYGLDELLTAIKKAKTNDKVKGIYLEGGKPIAAPATIQEIRQALLDFKESGKFIYAYADTYSQSGYYICSVADKVMVNPMGGIDWHGLASEPIFYKDMLEKLGVKMQVFRVGTYKSAVEPFTNTSMSEANRKQVTSYLFSIWDQMVKDVAVSRHIEEEKLNAYADSFMLLQPTEKFTQWKLADSLTYVDNVKAILQNKMEIEEDDDLSFVSVANMAKAASPNTSTSDNEIAIYCAFGEIVTSDVTSFIGNYSNYIASDKVIKDLKELRENKNVKAVVLRVNSPGGSAYASEQICHEVELLKAEKPVVVSMGGYAASGGYYISSGASQILAEPTTITGSIGIFGIIPEVSELLTQKLGLKFDVVKTNARSDFGSLSRPMNAEESRLMQAEIDRGYETFISRVAAGRKMKVEAVKKIAEGRVWTGKQAVKIGLVDKLGNIDDAVKCAASLAKVTKYSTAYYPTAAPWYTILLNDKKKRYMESQLRCLLGEYYPAFSLLRTLKSQDRVQMRIPFDPNIY